MKKPLPLLAALYLGGILASGTANAANLYSTNSQILTNSVGALGYTFDFNKFDQSLGTLTGINFTIVSSDAQGSFTVTNSTAASVKVYKPVNSLTVEALQGTLSGGNTTYYGDEVILTTSPDTGSSQATGATLGANSSATYTLNPANQTLEFNVLMPIDSSFWNLYQSSNGTGLVSFLAKSSPQVSVTGGQGAFDMSGVTANTVLQLDYSYTAVPEPSTYALFGLGGLALVVAYRRKRTA